MPEQEPDLTALGSDPDAFEAFYREHVAEVQRFVARRVDDPHAAADLTAEVFLAVIESASRYRASMGPPRAWLYGVARNVVLMERRRRGRETRAVRRSAGRRALAPDAMERSVERIDAERAARHLYNRISALGPDLRAVLELVAVDRLSVTEAALALGITPGAARVRLHRARRKVLGPDPFAHPHPLTQEAPR